MSITTVQWKKTIENIFERYPKDDWCRQTLQSQGVTEEKAKEWDRLAEGPRREHVATTAERERSSKTYSSKQTTAGGAGSVATAKHPDFAERYRMASRTCSSTRRQVLARNNTISNGRGKIGTTGKVRRVQGHRQQDGDFCSPSFRTEDPSTHAKERGDNAMRLRETDGVMMNEWFTI